MNTGRNRPRLITALLMLWLGSGLYGTAARAAEPVNDVRILIDISGSMKHNDPHNLRAPALRLLTGLLPTGARAGVWTYGQYVNMLVPLGPVDPAWQTRGRRAAAKINSYGLFTNIEGAMQRAARDWTAPDPNSRRSLIMLTDGFVDIAKDPVLNDAARDRIINGILPRLRDAKAKIYTIALSGEADHALLRQLSAATDGWSEEADSADELQRIFLHLFEKATHPDTLPLKANRVQVDSSIKEVTFLVFRDGNKPTELVDPAGHRFGKEDVPSDTRWHSDTGYDLITVTQPKTGQWQVVGPEDVDNRVMVVTNLKLRTTQLSNNLGTEDMPYFFMQMMQGDQVIRRKAFLDLVKVTLTQQQQDGQHWEWQLQDDGQGADMAAGDGTFSRKLAESVQEGRHELTLRVDGTTFQREQRQVINVHAHPAMATVTPDPTQAGHYVLSVIPYAGMIEPDTVTVSAVITDAEGGAHDVTLDRSGPAEWRAELTDHNDPAGYDAEFTVTGNHAGGKPVSSTLGPFHFSPAGKTAVVPAPAPAAEIPLPGEAPPVPAEEEMPPAPEPAEADKIDWLAVAWQTLLINALLIGGGYFGYRRWRKRAKPEAEALEEAEE